MVKLIYIGLVYIFVLMRMFKLFSKYSLYISISFGLLIIVLYFSRTVTRKIMTDNNYSIIYVTVPNKEVGMLIAKSLVTQNLAACANVIPNLTSVYMWESKINVDSEELLMIKTKSSLFSDVEQCVKSLHPYETPEIISVNIDNGSPEYLNWIKNVTK